MPISVIGLSQKLNQKNGKYLAYKTPQTARCVADRALTVSNKSQQSNYSKQHACIVCNSVTVHVTRRAVSQTQNSIHGISATNVHRDSIKCRTHSAKTNNTELLTLAPTSTNKPHQNQCLNASIMQQRNRTCTVTLMT